MRKNILKVNDNMQLCVYSVAASFKLRSATDHECFFAILYISASQWLWQLPSTVSGLT